MPMETPYWLDRTEFPFPSYFFPLEMGNLHYVDHGNGSPIVMVHGNPVWSFVYRHLIAGLADRYRCIAVDHIGFGLSDKPRRWSYHPPDHARNLDTFLEALDLEDVTLVVQDWGGPIGLSWALDHPERVSRLVILNTWMWSVRGDFHFETFSRFFGTPAGRFLILRFNFFVRILMPMMFRGILPKPIRRHYVQPLSRPEDRKGCWTFPEQILGADAWLRDLWSRRQAIAEKPALILWGLKDIAFRKQELHRWMQIFPDAGVIRYPDAGHFVQEDIGPDLCPVIEEFLSS